MSLKTQLQELSKNENKYFPNAKISEQLQQKVLIMVIGPAAVGKSSVMNKVIGLHSDFARVSGFTSRQPRPNDEPELYEYVAHTEASLEPVFREIERGELVQYAIHPTSQELYATRIEDYKGTYNLKDIFASVAEGLKKLPFKKTVTIGLVVNSQAWQEWFNERYPAHSSERTKRLEEAVLSLKWLLNQPAGEVLWVENKPGELAQSAEQLIGLCLNITKPNPAAETLAKQCLEKAIQLLGEKK